MPGDVRLVGGTSKCRGRLEVKYQRDWRPVDDWFDWNLKSSSVVCRELDCGSAVYTGRSYDFTDQPKWSIRYSCVGYEASLRECATMWSIPHAYPSHSYEVTCSGNKQ